MVEGKYSKTPTRKSTRSHQDRKTSENWLAVTHNTAFRQKEKKLKQNKNRKNCLYPTVTALLRILRTNWDSWWWQQYASPATRQHIFKRLKHKSRSSNQTKWPSLHITLSGADWTLDIKWRGIAYNWHFPTWVRRGCIALARAGKHPLHTAANFTNPVTGIS